MKRLIITLALLLASAALAQTQWEYAEIDFRQTLPRQTVSINLPDQNILATGNVPEPTAVLKEELELPEGDGPFMYRVVQHLGSQGWEMVHYHRDEIGDNYIVMQFYFKRPVGGQ